MKKIFTSIVSFCLLFTVVFTSIHARAEENESPTNYQYVFKVDSVDFHGTVNGESVNGSLLYPITIDSEFGRAGYDSHFDCPSALDWTIEYDAHIKTAYFSFYYGDELLQITHPDQTAFINEEEIPLEYHIERCRRTNENAEYCGKKVEHVITYLLPLRLVFEFTGHSVDWNPDTQEITVTYPATEIEE